MPTLYLDYLTGHTVFEHAGRRCTVHRDVKINSEVIAQLRTMAERLADRYSSSNLDRLARIQEFERATGEKFE